MAIHRIGVTLTFAATLLTLACAGRAPSPITYTVREAPTQDRALLLDVAQAVLISEGFEIGQVDTATAIISTKPAVLSAREATARDVQLSSRRALRRQATVRLTRADEATNVYCKVVVEEQTTEAHRLLYQEERGSDLPTYTAIDRDAATTAEQNTVWRTVRRDKAAERRVVDEILARSGLSP